MPKSINVCRMRAHLQLNFKRLRQTSIYSGCLLICLALPAAVSDRRVGRFVGDSRPFSSVFSWAQQTVPAASSAVHFQTLSSQHVRGLRRLLCHGSARVPWITSFRPHNFSCFRNIYPNYDNCGVLLWQAQSKINNSISGGCGDQRAVYPGCCMRIYTQYTRRVWSSSLHSPCRQRSLVSAPKLHWCPSSSLMDKCSYQCRWRTSWGLQVSPRLSHDFSASEASTPTRYQLFIHTHTEITGWSKK